MADFAASSHASSWVLGSDANVYGHWHAAMHSQGTGIAVRTSSGASEEDLSSLWAQQALTTQQRVMEMATVVRHFSCQIQLACGCVSNRSTERSPITVKTWRVAATAMVFLQRFYLNNSLLRHDPRVMVMACILLAGKVEESNVSMRELHRLHSKCKLEEILDAELALIKGLNYHLKVFHPQIMVVTLLADFKRACAPGTGTGTGAAGAGPADQAAAAALSEKCRAWLPEAERATDLLLLTHSSVAYPPLDVALAALVYTQPADLPLSLQGYLTRRFGEGKTEALLANSPSVLALLPVAEACAEGREAEAARAALGWLKQEQACVWGKSARAATKKARAE